MYTFQIFVIPTTLWGRGGGQYLFCSFLQTAFAGVSQNKSLVPVVCLWILWADLLNIGINKYCSFWHALIKGFFYFYFFHVVDEGNIRILFSAEDLGFDDAFVQRIRISPDQRYMATSFKSENSEEATCVVMKLGDFPVVEKVIPNVFSFGKLYL